MSSEISDFTPYVDTHNNILHIKYAEKTDDYGLGIRVWVSVTCWGEKKKNN